MLKKGLVTFPFKMATGTRSAYFLQSNLLCSTEEALWTQVHKVTRPILSVAPLAMTSQMMQYVTEAYISTYYVIMINIGQRVNVLLLGPTILAKITWDTKDEFTRVMLRLTINTCS